MITRGWVDAASSRKVFKVNSVIDSVACKRHCVCLLVFAGSLFLLGSCNDFTRLTCRHKLVDFLSSKPATFTGNVGQAIPTRLLTPSYYITSEETLELTMPAISAAVTASTEPPDDRSVPSISLARCPEVLGIPLLQDRYSHWRISEC